MAFSTAATTTFTSFDGDSNLSTLLHHSPSAPALVSLRPFSSLAPKPLSSPSIHKENNNNSKGFGFGGLEINKKNAQSFRFTVLQASSSSSSCPVFSDGGGEEDKEEEEEQEQQGLAREVVQEYLEKEIGASGEEAKQIAFNSPKYVAMLVEGVRDLDELSCSLSTNSWTTITGDDGLPPLSFKAKVYQLAKQKGDKGVLPFLESLGLTLPSATHLARYLSSWSLPHLIHQVKYLKKIFFSDCNDEGLGRNARHMMIHLSISVDEDLQHTLSFFEKIQARRGGLDLLGCQDSSFRCLIESFPRLLLLPLETHMKPIVEFLQGIGVPEGWEGKVLLLFPPIVFYDVEKSIKPRLMAFKRYGLEDKDIGKMLMKYPWILSTSIQENYEKFLELFEKEKVPEDSVTRAIKKQLHILGLSINKLMLKVKQFNDLGVRSKILGQVISRSPQLLLQRSQDFLQVIDFLQDLGLDEQIIGRILGRCPEIFATNIDKTLKKKLDFLVGIGISRSHLPRIIRKYPEFLVCDVNNALRPRVKYLMKIGLSRKDVGFMVRRFSPLLGYSIEKVLKPKVEFLVNIMEKPLSEVVDYPRYFSYSLEKKIKPRYWVLKGRSRDCSLKDMLSKNDEEFASEFMGIERMLVPPSSNVS